MVGTSGMIALVYEDPLDTSDESSTLRYRDLARCPIPVPAGSACGDSAAGLLKTMSAIRGPGQPTGDKRRCSGNALANTNLPTARTFLRTKVTYVYQAKYGGSLGFFNLTGGTNTANLSKSQPWDRRVTGS